jgi:hypothetical protein
MASSQQKSQVNKKNKVNKITSSQQKIRLQQRHRKSHSYARMFCNLSRLSKQDHMNEESSHISHTTPPKKDMGAHTEERRQGAQPSI